ncbi:hypothetical protein ACFQX7_27050 [Luedemannella flava]
MKAPNPEKRYKNPLPKISEASDEDQKLEVAEPVDGSSAQTTSGLTREVPSMRTPNSTTFANADGTSTMRVYSQPHYVPDGKGGFVELNSTLRDGAFGRLEPVAAAPVSIATVGSDAQLVKVQLRDSYYFGFGLAGAAAAAVTVAGDEAVFEDVRPHADVRLSATATGIKESIVLESAAARGRGRSPCRCRVLRLAWMKRPVRSSWYRWAALSRVSSRRATWLIQPIRATAGPARCPRA